MAEIEKIITITTEIGDTQTKLEAIERQLAILIKENEELAAANKQTTRSYENNSKAIQELTTDIQVKNQRLGDLKTKLDSTRTSTDKLTTATQSNRKSILDNGGAMGLLGAATGGLAMDFKDATEAIQLTGVSLKGLRGAIIATGIGALAIIVLELITNWEKWRDVILRTTPAMKALADVQKEVTSNLKETYIELFKVESAFKQAEKGAISKEAALKIYNETLGDTLGKANSLEEAEKIYADKTADYVKATQLRMTAQLLLAKAAEESAKVATGENLDLSFWEQAGVAVKGVFVGQAKATAEAIASNQIESKSDIQQLLELAEKFQTDADAIGGLNFGGGDKGNKGGDKGNKGGSGGKSAATKAIDDEKQRELEAYNAGIKAYADFLAKREELRKKYAEEKEQDELDEAYNIAQRDIAAGEERLRIDIDLNNRRIEAELLYQQARSDVLNSGLSILSAFAGKSKAIALTILAVEKGLAIAEIVTNASKSIGVATANLATVPAVLPPGVPNPAYPFAVASTISSIGATKISAAANIAAILATTINSAKNITSGAGSAAGGSAGGGGTASVPQFNIVGQSSTNQLAQSINKQQTQPVKAYVVSSEISNQQALDRNRIQNSTFLAWMPFILMIILI